MKKICVTFVAESGMKFTKTFIAKTVNEASVLAANYVSANPGLFCKEVKVEKI